jgi:hypothetical protein
MWILFLLVLALVLFLLATFKVPARVDLIAAGLFCITLAYAVSRGLVLG